MIGRGEHVEVYLPDFQASRRHAVIRADAAGFQVEDLGSHNGTWVNHVRVGRATLSVGDELQIGATRLEVAAGDTADRALLHSLRDGQIGMVPQIVRPMARRLAPTLADLMSPQYLDGLTSDQAAPGDNAPDEGLHRLATQTRSFAIVLEIARTLGEAPGLDELLTRVLDQIMEAVVVADRGFVILIDPATGELVPGAVRLRGSSETGETPADGFELTRGLDVSRSIVNWVAEHQSGLVLGHASSDARFSDTSSVEVFGLHSVVCVPMLRGAETVGVIQLDNRFGRPQFGEGDLELVSALAPILAVAVENARLLESRAQTIEELRASHAMLVATQAELVDREKLAVVGRFTSGLAHEIRNLLGPFVLADLLQEEYPHDARIQEYTAVMLDAYKRVGALVAEIGLLAKGERRSRSTSTTSGRRWRPS